MPVWVFTLHWIWNSYCFVPPPPQDSWLLLRSSCWCWWLTLPPDNGTEWTAYWFVRQDTSQRALAAEQRRSIYLHCVAARGVDASNLGVTGWGGKQATCQLMTNIVHFQPICFLCALDEVSNESNLWSGPHTDNEQYVSGTERCMHQLSLPHWALWWMRAITVDACDFSSMWTTNIGLSPQVCVCVCFSPSHFSFSFSGLHTPEEVPGGSVPAMGAKIYYTIIVIAF